jgi:hypothetical protein
MSQQYSRCIHRAAALLALSAVGNSFASSRLNGTTYALQSVCAALAPVKIVVIPFAPGFGSSDALASKMTSLIAEQVRSKAEIFELVEGVSKSDKFAEGSKKSNGPKREVLVALAEGKKAMEELRFDEAIPALKKGLELMLTDPASADFEMVCEALVKLSVAAFRTGHEKEAKSQLLELARLSPRFELPPNYPPVFLKEFEKARKKVAKLSRGQLSVEGPPGSIASVDGRELGPVPRLEENLPIGAHYVKVVGATGERFAEALELKNGMSKVKASFSTARGVVASLAPSGATATALLVPLEIDESVRQQVQAFAQRAGAEFALVGHVAKTSETLMTAGAALYSVKKNEFSLLPAALFDTDAESAKTEAVALVSALEKKAKNFGEFTRLPFVLVKNRRSAESQLSSSNERSRKTEPGRIPQSLGGPEESDLKNPGKSQSLVPLAKPEDDAAIAIKTANPSAEKPRAGISPWVWIAGGVALAAGAGLGGYFGYQAATKPVTGTVTATW